MTTTGNNTTRECRDDITNAQTTQRTWGGRHDMTSAGMDDTMQRMQGRMTRRNKHQRGPTPPNDEGANDMTKARTAGYDSASRLTTAWAGYNSTSGLTTAPGGYNSASKATMSTGRSTRHDQGGMNAQRAQHDESTDDTTRCGDNIGTTTTPAG